MKRIRIIFAVLLIILIIPALFALENNKSCIGENETGDALYQQKCCEWLGQMTLSSPSPDGKQCSSYGTQFTCSKSCGDNICNNNENKCTCEKDCNNIVGNDKDSHGCIGSAGYSWCEEKQKCLRTWEENCSNSKMKILPETASLKARERLGELGFNVSLKEIGNKNKTKTIYEAKAQQQGKLFGFLNVQADVSAEIDAETGEIIKVHKPWLSFLAGI